MKMEGKRKKEVLETKRFPSDLIIKKVELLLNSPDAQREGIQQITTDPEVNFSGENKLKLNTSVLMKTSRLAPATNIAINLTLGNQGSGGVSVTEHNFESKSKKAAKAAEKKLLPYFAKISELLKSDIEEDEKREVGKIEIIKGELRVTFASPEIDLDNPEVQELRATIENIQRSINGVKRSVQEGLYASAQLDLSAAADLLERLKETKYENTGASKEQAEKILLLESKISKLKNEIDPVNREAIAAERADREEMKAQKIAEIEARIAAFRAPGKANGEATLEQRKADKIAEIEARINRNQNT